VEICLRDDVQHSTDYWDDVQLVHCALPEVDLASIDTTTTLFGHDIGAPLVIASMTGGHEHGADINDHLAAAAAKLRLPMGVGSQRPALEHPSYARTYAALKEHDVPLVIANIGAPQLVRQRGGRAMGPREVRAAMEMIDADMVAVHLNFLQEVAQPEGDTNAEGVLAAIELLAAEFPVIVKETGGGISQEIALKLKAVGVRGIDVGGAGGTSFAAVEAVRSEERGLATRARLGWAFKDWGIPTPVSTLEANVGLPVIATGGVRSGLDVARALVLGASAAGVARRVLGPSLKGRRETEEALGELIAELGAAMFLTGSRDVGALRERDFVLSDRLMAWVDRLVQEGE
jgi:isopentenyl-diphosphate delta-isomerase